jgi:hypothetical protein
MKTIVKSFLLILGFSLILSSCKKDDTEQTGVNVKLTDGPFPFEFVTHANVGVTKVEVKTADGEYITVYQGAENYNMVQLTNGETADVTTGSEVPEGTYVMARVSLSGATVSLNNGSTFDMSNQPHTIEVNIQPALVVTDDTDTDLLFDLDLGNSFAFFGQSMPFEGWIPNVNLISSCTFNPSLRACNLDLTGSINGQLVDEEGNPVGNAQINIIVNNHSIHTHTDAEGHFTFIGIAPGTYTVAANTPSSQYAQVSNITVTAGNESSCQIQL